MLSVGAIFNIHNSTVKLVVGLLLLFLGVIWLSLIYWTFADARRRVGDPLLVACATAASLFPYVGTLVYVIVRPPEYLEDVHERELEIQAAEARLAGHPRAARDRVRGRRARCGGARRRAAT